ncbi:unnamed protein product [Spirodela intermedia]|uniref:RRM domain-containing protein n=1 Tax=Spirodela intermedia TaxID=51605 RepID=A0A7I8IK51_SPIIN|nr:unnamed protein product [Spirodela intermedia]CAA6657518.1 unnamed protein product [Spirodela intermedia]
MEQPLKKRRLIETAPEASGVPSQQELVSSSLPFSQEEILRKRRNRDEIRKVHDCYKRIRFYIGQKDSRLMPDFEQAYLYLITASRGCTSVQRIVAELIPHYVSFCPTALEAAAKVLINMHNWSVAIIMRGDDLDGVAYQTVKACIFGLVDICCTASSEASTSPIIQGFCSTVFVNVLSFFASTFEGQDIYLIGSKAINRLEEPLDLFCELRQEKEDDDQPALDRLFRFRALCLLKILFCCPKHLLGACFELVSSGSTDVGGHNKGLYFLNQVTTQLNEIEVSQLLNRRSNEESSLADSMQISVEDKTVNEERVVSATNNVHDKLSNRRACLLETVIYKEPSLREWILVKCKRLRNSHHSEAMTGVTRLLERVFGSSPEIFQDLDNYVTHKSAGQHDKSVDTSVRDLASKSNDLPVGGVHAKNDECSDALSQTLRPHLSLVPSEAYSLPVGESDKCEGSVLTAKLGTSEKEESPVNKSFLRKDSSSSFVSSVTRKSWDDNDGLEKVMHVSENRKNPLCDVEVNSAAMGSCAANILASPRQHFSPSSQAVWYSDGDPAAMDVYSASKQLWFSSLGHDASETVVRLQFEDFGPVKHFYFFEAQDFALIEYRNIMDAVRAREFMGFMDSGLGARGAIHGVAIGDSCHVYVGKVSNQHAKEELLQGLIASGLNGPRTVTDLTSESAIMLEFASAEQAALAMEHIRKKRKESRCHGHGNTSLSSSPCIKENNGSFCQLLVRHIDSCLPEEELINAFSIFGELIGWKFIRQSGFCLLDFRSYEAADLAKTRLNGVRFGSMHISVEMRSGSFEIVGSGSVSSPSTSSMHNSLINDYRSRMSQLSALFSSLCTRYGINQSNQVASDTLCISLPDVISPSFDDELKAFCNFAAGNAGSVVKLTRSNVHNSCWIVEFSCVDGGVAALKNIQSCPGIFLHVAFSRSPAGGFYHDEQKIAQGAQSISGRFQSLDGFCSINMEIKPGSQHIASFPNQPDSNVNEIVSPRIKLENVGQQKQKEHAFLSKWGATVVPDMMETAVRDDDPRTNMVAEPQFVEVHEISQAMEQSWKYDKRENDHQLLASDSVSCPPPVIPGAALVTPPPIQSTSFMHPVLFTPCNSWDTHTVNPPLQLNQMPAAINPNNNLHINTCVTVPFIPPSVTPLAQLPGGSVQHLDQMTGAPLSSSLPPPPPDVPPPLPPPPPPLPISQPPFVPPPPSSPPPHFQTSSEISNAKTNEVSANYQWQGALCKSGVHYCTVNANRENSEKCKYSSAISEPADWPSKLDVTKRTAFRHVMTTFSSTQPINDYNYMQPDLWNLIVITQISRYIIEHYSRYRKTLQSVTCNRWRKII